MTRFSASLSTFFIAIALLFSPALAQTADPDSAAPKAATITWQKIPAGLTVNEFSEKEDLWGVSAERHGVAVETTINRFRKEISKAITPLLENMLDLYEFGTGTSVKKSREQIVLFIFPYTNRVGPAAAYTGYYHALPLEDITASRDGKLATDVAKALVEHYKEVLGKK